jgi:hypothetical protein
MRKDRRRFTEPEGPKTAFRPAAEPATAMRKAAEPGSAASFQKKKAGVMCVLIGEISKGI